ncbi:unnamed protein product [Ixodes pacificus]
MKIPASTALAVVAVFLPIVTCAAEEEDDRSCEKRDKEAKEVGEKVVDSCNYWCLPNKEDPNNYVNKYYPDGTKCNFGQGLQSLCIQEACHHPDSDIYKSYVSKKPKSNEVPPRKTPEETPDAPTSEEEPHHETSHNADEGHPQEDENEEEVEGNEEEEDEDEEEEEDEGDEEEENKEEEEDQEVRYT